MLACVAALPATAPCQEQPAPPRRSETIQLDEAGNEVEAHLVRVKAFLADRQWDEAVETLRQLIQTHGQQVIALAPGQYVSLRDYCHSRIARLPPPALELYRQRVDPLARRWYEQATRERNEELLGRVVDQFFCSSVGDQALFALGELALERGEYARARDAWERIHPALKHTDGRPLWHLLRDRDLDADWPALAARLGRADPPVGWLAYLDSDIDVADVRARLVLVAIFAGDLPRARLELELFRRLHPDARGRLGGREVGYVEKLESLLASAADWPRRGDAHDWPTFAGATERTRVADRPVRLGDPAWAAPIRLEPVQPEQRGADAGLAAGGFRVGEEFNRPLSYHPLIVDDLLLVADKRKVYAYDLATGRPAWGREEAAIYEDEAPHLPPPRHARRSLGVPRFTLTARGGRLVARIGEPVTGWGSDAPPGRRSGYLVCLDLEADGRIVSRIEPESPAWAFEGTPLLLGNDIYVAMRRSGAQPRAHVACYDSRTGRRKWRRLVCGARTTRPGQVDEITHNLLTLHEDVLYYNSNLGAVAALRASDGHALWVRRYERSDPADLSRRAAHFHRDLNPCVYHRGLVLVAPTDSEHVMALDATTGQLLWASDQATDAVHLLGVADRYLLASGDRLWWFDVSTGKVVHRTPDNPRGGLRGIGRGTIAGNEILWPSREAIHFFDARPPFRPTQLPLRLNAPGGARGGNVVAARGFVVVAGTDRIDGFTQLARERATLKKRVAANPRDPLAHYRLALCEEAEERIDEAVRLCRRAMELARDNDSYRGEPLRPLAAGRLERLLRGRARELSRAGDWPRAVETWQAAARAAQRPAARWVALSRAADGLLAMGQPAAAVGGLQAIAVDPQLAGLQIPVGARHTRSARDVAQERIGQLRARHGRKLAAELDDEARAALDALPAGDRAALAAWLDHFPHAAEVERVRATLRRAPREPRGAPVDRAANHVPRLPPVASWDRATTASVLIPDRDPVVAANSTARAAPSAAADVDAPGECILLVTAERVECLAADDGVTRWTIPAPLADPPTWSAAAAELLLLGGPAGLVAVDARRGEVRWRQGFGEGAPSRPTELPAQFQLHASHVVVHRGERELVALDARTGQPAWSHTPPAGARLGDHAVAIGESVLLQHVATGVDRATGLGSAAGDRFSTAAENGETAVAVALDLADGRLRFRLPSARPVPTDDRLLPLVDPAGDVPWLRPPLPWGEYAAVVATAAGQIELLDLARGRRRWTRRPPGASPEAPLDVVVSADAVVALTGNRQAVGLHPDDGRSLWPSPATLRASDRGSHAADVAGRTLYCAGGGRLQAIDLASGRSRWSTHVARTPQRDTHARRLVALGGALATWSADDDTPPGAALALLAPDGRLACRVPLPAGPLRVVPVGRQLVIASPGRVRALPLEPAASPGEAFSFEKKGPLENRGNLPAPAGDSTRQPLP